MIESLISVLDFIVPPAATIARNVSWRLFAILHLSTNTYTFFHDQFIGIVDDIKEGPLAAEFIPVVYYPRANPDPMLRGRSF